MKSLKSVTIVIAMICTLLCLTTLQAGWETESKEQEFMNGTVRIGVQIQAAYEFPFAIIYPYAWIW